MITSSGRFRIFRAAVRALVTAREREAMRTVNQVLMSMDDETLKGMGRSRHELTGKRGGVPLP